MNQSHTYTYLYSICTQPRVIMYWHTNIKVFTQYCFHYILISVLKLTIRVIFINDAV